ncbi:hypothetical protein JCM6882_006101 [Rhodosporidiobolus microsporus]
MTRSAPRYAGPPPPCPPTLDSPPPQLMPEMLQVPTSELYAASLREAWGELNASGAGSPRQPSSERVEELEPNPTRDDRPVPKHYGPYAEQRGSLDWTYHVVPSRERQTLQDEIVKVVLDQRVRECKDAGDDEPCRVSERRMGMEEGEKEEKGKVGGVDDEKMGRKNGEGEEGRPLALFTAGGMGAGKGHTLREMLKTGRIRLPANTVWIDPDALSRYLPERPQYLSSDPSTASALLHPEASLLQEICAATARGQKRSLVVDGSLTDCGWFEGFMRQYREEGYDCEILFVSAPEDVMLKRAEKRAKTTGRVTNPDAIKRSRIKSPECVTALSKPGLVRRVRLIDNSSDSSSADATGPVVLYDSALDPSWPGNSPTSYHPRVHDRDGSCSCPGRNGRKDGDVEEGGWVDAKGFVEGRLVQGEDGRVRKREGGGGKGASENGAGEGRKGKM